MSDYIVRPALDEWASLLKQQPSITKFLDQSIPSDLSKRIRAEMFQAAQQYTADWPEKNVAYQQDRPIIAFGHQPVVYHPGLLSKHEKLLEFTKATAANGLEIIIDTDQGPPVAIRYPRLRGRDWTVEQFTVATQAGLYLSQSVAINAADSSWLPNEKLSDFIDALKRYGGQPVAQALPRLRHEFLNDQNSAVIALSELMRLPSIRQLVDLILVKPKELVETYNQTLHDFRLCHKIKNAANPFPNLKSDEHSLELPFWIIDSQANSREELFFNLASGQFNQNLNERERFFLAPRGMLTTFILRTFCCDLFIHGLGGEKYDPATELFAERSSVGKIAPFVVVSFNSYLLADQAQELHELDDLLARQREIYNHAEVALNLLENDAARQQLQELLGNLKGVRERLIAGKKSGQSVAAIQAELSQLNLEIRELLDKFLFNPAQSRLNALEPSRAALTARDFSYFLF